MSILDSIKGERRMSYKNWRYRLLFWCFNVDGTKLPTDPTEAAYKSGLPRFLFTHFCPLFHLTNMIAILSPVIVFVKFVRLLIWAAVAATNLIPAEKIQAIMDRLAAFLPKRGPRKEYVVSEEPVSLERQKAVDRQYVLQSLPKFEGEFNVFWAAHCAGVLKGLNEEDVKILFDEYYPKVQAARERARKRRERLRQNIIFWANFSRVFLKYVMNALYIGIVLGLLYLGYEVSGWVWDAICWVWGGVCWMFSGEGAESIWWFLKHVLVIGGLLAVFVFLTIKFVKQPWTHRFFGHVGEHVGNTVMVPVNVFSKAWGWVKSGWNGFLDFCKTFYEENCPPITILPTQVAEVEEAAEQAVENKEVA